MTRKWMNEDDLLYITKRTRTGLVLYAADDIDDIHDGRRDLSRYGVKLWVLMY